MKNPPKEKHDKQTGTPDLATFLREISGRVGHVPKKLMKHYAQDPTSGYVWRGILKNTSRVKK